MKAATWWVLMDADDMEDARRCGTAREDANRAAGRRNHFVIRDDAYQYEKHIMGAASEFALHVMLDIHWPATTTIYRDTSDCAGYEVRWNESRRPSLILRRTCAEGIYVLMTGKNPFTALGWMRASEARQPKWWVNRKPLPAYFVPASALHPMHALPGLERFRTRWYA